LSFTPSGESNRFQNAITKLTLDEEHDLFDQLNGYRFDELGSRYQSRYKSFKLMMQVIPAQADPDKGGCVTV
jgi:hypothetical protein